MNKIQVVHLYKCIFCDVKDKILDTTSYNREMAIVTRSFLIVVLLYGIGTCKGAILLGFFIRRIASCHLLPLICIAQ